MDPEFDEGRDIKGLIDAFNAEQAMALEQDLFTQRKRLGHGSDAGRSQRRSLHTSALH